MAHARDSDAQVLVVALDVVQEDFLVLELVLERLQVGFLLVLRLHFLRVGVQALVKRSLLASLFKRGVLLRIVPGLLGFADFLVDFGLDLLQLLLSLPVVVREDHQFLALVLDLLRVLIRFQLKTHRLSLVQAGPSLHKFLLRVVLIHLSLSLLALFQDNVFSFLINTLRKLQIIYNNLSI